MIITIEQARDTLRLDGTDNDSIIYAFLEAIPDYLAVTTGYKYIEGMEASPLAKTVAKFLLQLWYNGDGIDTEKLQRTINNLLTALDMSNRKQVTRSSAYYNRNGYYDPTAGKAITNADKANKKKRATI